MMLTAKALLEENLDPTEDEIVGRFQEQSLHGIPKHRQVGPLAAENAQ